MGDVVNITKGTEVPQEYYTQGIDARLHQPHESEKEFRDDRELFFFINDMPNGALKQNAIAELKKIALDEWKIKAREFNSLFKGYKEDWVKRKAENGYVYEGAFTSFSGQTLKLRCGNWVATDAGVWKIADEEGNQELACHHPLIIERILKNRQTKQYKVVLAYNIHKRWERTIHPKSMIVNSQTVVSLSDFNIDVTSENSKLFVSYLRELMNKNTDIIPQNESTASLGWIENGFIPFSGGIEFDGESEYHSMFESIKEKGSYKTWLEHMRDIRHDICVRIVTSSSLASILLKPLGLISFAVHLYGRGSSGKTVAQMAAASMWGDPTKGKYLRTMNSTQNYVQRMASFLNDLPVILDELQTVRQSTSFENYDKFIYGLMDGADRGKAKAAGGVEYMGTWNNIFIFSGEEPITADNSGGGSKNRVIELSADNAKIIANGRYTANLLRDNYGFAGHRFIEIVNERLEDVKKTYNELFEQFIAITDDKQAMAAACIITADRLAAREIFKEAPLLFSECAFMVRDVSDSSIADRAYTWLMDTITVNMVRFSENNGEVWGEVVNDECWFIPTKLKELMDKAGYNMKAIQSEWRDKGYIEFGKDGKITQVRRIQGKLARCYKIKIREM